MAAADTPEHEREWIIGNGAGLFALGCVDRVPRRKYHTLFSLADGLGIQSQSRNLVLDVIEQVRCGEHIRTLVNPRGEKARGGTFSYEPAIQWTYDLGSAKMTRKLKMPQTGDKMPHAAKPVLQIHYRLEANSTEPESIKVEFEPWLLSRPLHVETKLNSALWGSPIASGNNPHRKQNHWRFQLYSHEPIIRFSWHGIEPTWFPEGRWETDLVHTWEAERGYASTEDVFIPGRFEITWDGQGAIEYFLQIEWETPMPLNIPETRLLASASKSSPSKLHDGVKTFKTRLSQSARVYSAAIRDNDSLTPTLIAGLPWFGPWGRDTFIALPGYVLATGRSQQAYSILASLGRRLRDALLEGTGSGPSTSHRGQANINLHGVDTPFLFVWAIDQLDRINCLKPHQAGVLREFACEILNQVALGAFNGVQISPDGRVQLKSGSWAPTWMDARLDDRPVTPRQSEPIEINALFVYAIAYLREHEDRLARLSEPLRELARTVPTSLAQRYWNKDLGYFSDTIGEGASDLYLRPNQLWLLALDRIDIDQKQGQSALKCIQQLLLTPVGLRTLSPHDPPYKGHCEGSQRSRDIAYHQGTVWPWMLGLFTDAMIRFNGTEATREILQPCIQRLNRHLRHEGCINQISEIFDGNEPHRARGTPAQAWSVTEVYRMLGALEQ
jgi:predicted glycogen debranching enzyme